MGIITVKTNSTTGTIKTALTGGSNPTNVTAGAILGIGSTVVSGTPNVAITAGGLGTETATATFDATVTLSVGQMFITAHGTTPIYYWVRSVTTAGTVYEVVGIDGLATANATSAAVDWAGNASIWKHVFSPGNRTETRSARIITEYGDLTAGTYQETHKGCKVESLELKVEGEGNNQLVASMEIVGALMDENTPGDTAYNSGIYATESDLSKQFEHFDWSVTEGGASFGEARNVMVMWKNNHDMSQYCIDGSGGTRRALPSGDIAVNGSMDALFADVTVLQKAINRTESSLTLTGSENAEASLTFTIDRLYYKPVSAELTAKNTGIVHPFEWRAFKNKSLAGQDPACVVTLINDKGGYL